MQSSQRINRKINTVQKSSQSSVLKMFSGTSFVLKIYMILLFITICKCKNDNDINSTTPLSTSTITALPPTTTTTTTTTASSSTTKLGNNNKKFTKYHEFNNTIVKYESFHHNNTTKSTSSSSLSPPITMLSTGNELWDDLINECLTKPTISCFQKNIHNYFDGVLNMGDVNVTNNFMLYKNKVDYYKYTKEANEDDNDLNEKENEIPDEEARSDSPIEEVTDALYGKSIKFMMTHDIQLKMPDMLFNGATIRLSPKSFEGNGALVKFEIVPKELIKKGAGTGRILFKKIKKFFKNKLLLSFLAIVLVIKLIKIKVMWLLPLIIGVTAAKKLLLKFLLFLFPALSHLFKLCTYYHNNYHQTKFYHHQHHINHHHTVIPPWFNEPHHDHGHEHGHDHGHDLGHDSHAGPELIFTAPPKGHPSEYLHGAPPPHYHNQNNWEFSGPGLGSEYINDIHRSSHINTFKPKLDDENEINSWGLGTTGSPSSNSYSKNLNPFAPDASQRLVQQRPSPVYTPNNAIKRTPITSQIESQYNSGIEQQMIKEAQRLQAQQQEALRIQAEQRIIAQQQKILQQQPFVHDPQDLTPNFIDPFFSPILIKIDKIFLQLGFTDEPCRERLVCSMYKNPEKYSPHSNFISAELSRDSINIEKAEATNAAAIRFYRYVEAARNGQDQNDCLRLYAHCLINTETK